MSHISYDLFSVGPWVTVWEISVYMSAHSARVLYKRYELMRMTEKNTFTTKIENIVICLSSRNKTLVRAKQYKFIVLKRKDKLFFVCFFFL